MKAIAIVPGRPETAGVFDMPEPPKSDGSVLVRTLSVGLCGTDLEIALGGYGVPPPGEERLVLGHESIGEVIDAPKGSGLEPGNLVVGIGPGGLTRTLRSLCGRRMGYVPKRGLR